MLIRHLRLAAAPAVMVLCVWVDRAPAQTGTGTTAPSGEATPAESLDPDAVFTEIERGDAVGSTAATGQGFSDLSVSPTTAGRGGLGGLGGLGGGLGGGFGGLGNLFGGFGAGPSQSSQQPIIRTRLRSGITARPTPPEVVQRSASGRFRYLPSSHAQLRGINVVMQGRTAVISGQVGSERDRRMSEMLMRLEPGVGNVINEVAVVPPSSQ